MTANAKTLEATTTAFASDVLTLCPEAGMVGGPVAEPEVAELLHQMQKGDREAAAMFVTLYGSRIKRRIRGKLNPDMRRLFDSTDILSTLGRRLDQYVGAGRFRADSENQLWALVFKMANNAVVDKARVFGRFRRAEGEDSPFAQEMLRRLKPERHHPDPATIQLALQLCRSELDRDVLSLWLTGSTFEEIADQLGLEASMVRKRWQRLRERLRIALEAERDG